MSTSGSASVSPQAIDAFWKRIAYLTSRSRLESGELVGTPEVKAWNLLNLQSCDKCLHARNLRHCIIEEDQASCRGCRDSRSACDRKLKFLFESTRDEFFETLEEFMEVYQTRDPRQWRALKRTVNRQRKATLPYRGTAKLGSTAPPVSHKSTDRTSHCDR